MFYTVPQMSLIPQDKSMSCWFASGQMLINWDQVVWQQCAAAHPDPSMVAKWGKLYDKNTGITNDKILEFAPSQELLYDWLVDFGPLWVNGVKHITVIAGIRDNMNGLEVLVYDPAMPNKVHGEWRPISWYTDDTHSGRDTGTGVEATFLHLPS
jgi:Papain-like cysteine protease AvrRpt2